MGIGVKWSTSALLGAAAGVGAALARARRPRRVVLPPRETMGVDGLGEVQSADLGDTPPSPAEQHGAASLAAPAEAVAESTAPSTSADDAIRALDEARDRLRRRADELAREMGGGADS